jgi:hypothetical protein
LILAKERTEVAIRYDDDNREHRFFWTFGLQLFSETPKRSEGPL